MPTDLVALGFVPEGMEALNDLTAIQMQGDVVQSEVVATLASVYGQWSSGGGAKQALQGSSPSHDAKVDVNGLFNEIQGGRPQEAP